MKPLLTLAVLFSAAAASGQVPPGAALPAARPCAFPAAPSGIHPAVVRVIVPDRDSTSLGSGSLVAVSQNHGLVLTNWHVVRDAAGPITVAFPDGFRSLATVLRVDRDWDLAALAIWRPNVQPIPLATAAPQLGEPLAIAGYGDGAYRAAAGRCTQYVSPGQNQPYEMVELSAAARNGDSGGPIFNTRGELAGVLFGSARGETTGSYCGRVQWFVTPVMETFWRLPPPGTMIAETRTPGLTQPGSEAATPKQAGADGVAAARPGANGIGHPRVEPGAAAAAATPNRPVVMVSGSSSSPAAAIRGGQTAAPAAQTGTPGSARPAAIPLVSESDVPAANQDPAADGKASSPSESGFWEQVKNVLAAIGAVAILLQTLRLFAVSSAPPAAKSAEE